MFSCKFCEISKNTFFTEHLRTTASTFSFPEAANGGVLWINVFLKIFQNSLEIPFCFAKFSKTPFLQNTSGRLLLLIAFRSSYRMCSMKKGVLEKFAKFTGKGLSFCEISKNNFFTEHIRKTASAYSFQKQAPVVL